MAVPCVLDTGAGLIPPTDAIAWGKQHGYDVRGIAAYLEGNVGLCDYDGSPKWGTHPWLSAMAEANLQVVFLWELSPTAPDEGAPQGTSDGETAAACAKVLGAPSGTVIYFANDSEVGSWPAVEAYYRAASEACAPYVAGVYGQASVYEATGLHYLFKAPDGTDSRPPGIRMIQVPNACVVDGMTCDRDDLTDYDFGGWNLDPPPAPVKPPPGFTEVRMPIVTSASPKIEIICLQRLLYGWGHHAVAFTGKWDEDTDTAVFDFQHYHDIGRASRFGPECWYAAATNAVRPPPVISGKSGIFMPIVSRRSPQAVIICLQKLLYGRGYRRIEYTGKWDRDTDTAVKEFQRFHDIGKASHWGPECWLAASTGHK